MQKRACRKGHAEKGHRAATRRIEHFRRVPGQRARGVLARPVAQQGWDARCDFRPLKDPRGDVGVVDGFRILLYIDDE